MVRYGIIGLPRTLQHYTNMCVIRAVGAVAVTVPTCYYLLQNAPDTSHSHGEHGDDHGKSHGEEEQPDEEPVEEPAKSEDGESQDEEQDSKKPEESGSDDGDNEADTPDTSDDEGSDEDKQDGNTVKHIPDAKGGAKKRLESEKGIKQGEASKTDGDDEKSHDKVFEVDHALAETIADDLKAAASKPAGSKNSQSGKQEGLSNTDTTHSTDIAQDPEKSSKGDGMPETAKAKGTVDPKRPQV